MESTERSTAHTPGPWWPTTSNCKEIYGRESHESVMAEGRMVADICPCGLDEEAGANARLIAAAPELWDALDSFLEQTVDMDLAYGIELTEGEKEARAKALAVFEKFHEQAA